MHPRRNRVGRTVVLLAGLIAGGAIGWLAFVVLPTTLADVVGVLLAVGVALLGVRAGRRLADRAFPTYNVVEVAVEGPITRGGDRAVSVVPGGVSADEVVERIEAADRDPHARALLVKLNTPGGEIVPSDDVRRAVAAFDGPTIAYTVDQCASGGYWIATGCDALWAREGSLVGSIGVRSGVVTAEELASRLGFGYEGFSRGKYKEAGQPLRALSDDDRAYLQGIADDYYDQFVERVVEGRELAAETVRGTEARVYLGGAALELGLVDALGTRDDVESALEAQLGEPVEVRTLAPARGVRERIGLAGLAVAHAFGVGVASALVGTGEFSLGR